MEISRPTPRRHLPVLDGLRGLAIIAVLLRHSAYVFQGHGTTTRWFLPVMLLGGWGVDLFFALSGFLITGILLDTRSALNRVSSFYGRRVLRIFPVYYLALGLVLLAAPFFPWVKAAANMQNAADRLSYCFYFQNWIPLWHHGDYPESFLGHFWSLAVEEQFYLIWPAVVWHLTTRGVARLCAAALLFTFVVRIFLVAHFGSSIWLYAFTLTRADGLYVGSALAAIFALKGQLPNRLLAGLTAGGLAALATVVALGPARALWQTGTYMAMFGILGIALLSGALIVYSLRFSEGRLGKFFQQRWIRTFGKYSYGMYVWHFPIYYSIQHFMQLRSVVFPLPTAQAIPYVAFLVAASYAVAWLSFNGYEQWFLRLKTHFEPVFNQHSHSQSVSGWISQPRPVVDRP
jgi:peptidoglycan/LPS O-acetylase OafA/YrhL